MGCGTSKSEQSRLVPPDDSPVPNTSTVTLRLVHVTDVYTLENFPSLRTLILEKRAALDAKLGAGAKTVSVLTGDFLMPYLLSTIDHGKGMLDQLNATPIDYLTWGNHECDLKHEHVMAREREYNGVLINSNMKQHESYADSKCQTDAAWIELKSPDGSNVRKVAMIGVLTNGSGLYKKGHFGFQGLPEIDDPWVCMAEYKVRLEAEGADLVIPLCHLYEPEDERTAREFDFPLILSGHDHHLVDKVVAGTRILKPGSDAHHAIVIDLTWTDGDAAGNPHIEAETIKVNQYSADPAMLQRVKSSYAALDGLRLTQLTQVPSAFRPLTSKGERQQRVTMGTYLCSELRDAFNMEVLEGEPMACDCFIAKAGSMPRGGRDYTDDEHLTLEVLMSELPEKETVSVSLLPGRVLRGGLRETWYAPQPGWFQFCDAIEVDGNGYVVSVRGKPLDHERLYKVGSCTRTFFRTRDGPSIGAYYDEDPSRKPDHDLDWPAQALLMRYFGDCAWKRIANALDADRSGSIDLDELSSLDKDNDGQLDAQELMHALKHKAGMSTFDGERSLVKHILRAAGDADDDGKLSLDEINQALALRRERSSKRDINRKVTAERVEATGRGVRVRVTAERADVAGVEVKARVVIM